MKITGPHLIKVYHLGSLLLFSCLSCIWLFSTPQTTVQQVLCPLLSPGVCSNSRPLSQWCYLTISSSATIFSFGIQCFLAPGSFPMSQLSVSLYIRRPKYWSFSFSISPSSEYSRLISFMIDRLDPLAVQRILNSLLQSHNSKASVLWLLILYYSTLTSVHE